MESPLIVQRVGHKCNTYATLFLSLRLDFIKQHVSSRKKFDQLGYLKGNVKGILVNF